MISTNAAGTGTCASFCMHRKTFPGRREVGNENVVDYVIIGVIGLSVLFGIYRGFVASVLNMGGCLISFGLSFWLYPEGGGADPEQSGADPDADALHGRILPHRRSGAGYLQRESADRQTKITEILKHSEPALRL